MGDAQKDLDTHCKTVELRFKSPANEAYKPLFKYLTIEFLYFLSHYGVDVDEIKLQRISQ